MDLIETLRRRVPGMALRTNVIVGFPGETEAHFQELLEFQEWAAFEKLVAFPFSAEDSAPAARLDEPVAPDLIQERLDRVLARQGSISLAANRAQVGRRLEVLVEAPAGEAGRPARGRSYREAPEVDGCVRVAGTGLRPGAFYPVTITGADAYDLVGIAAGAPDPEPRPVEISDP
jgi:ribosomal protein S12 methylthiotransferase